MSNDPTGAPEVKAEKPAKSSAVKWLVIAFLGTAILVFAAFFLFLSNFTPLVQIDDRTGSVSILGGLIDIKGIKGKDISEETKTMEGGQAMQAGEAQKIRILFSNGIVRISNSENLTVSWSCEVPKKFPDQTLVADGKDLKFDLKAASGVDCRIEFPKAFPVQVVGANGEIQLFEPNFPVDATLQNGRIQMSPNEKAKYHYDVKSKNGSADSFESSADKDAYAIHLEIANGEISRE